MKHKSPAIERLHRAMVHALILVAVSDTLAAVDAAAEDEAERVHDAAQAALAAGDYSAVSAYLAGVQRRVKAAAQAQADEVIAALEASINADATQPA